MDEIYENAGARKSDKMKNTPSKNISSHHGCLDFLWVADFSRRQTAAKLL